MLFQENAESFENGNFDSIASKISFVRWNFPVPRKYFDRAVKIDVRRKLHGVSASSKANRPISK
jgi:hypothetical protein